MKKALVGRILFLLGVLLAMYSMYLGYTSRRLTRYLIELSTTNFFFFRSDLFPFVGFLSSFILFTISFFKEKNYTFTRWLLFVVLVFVVVFSLFVLYEMRRSSDAFGFFLVFGGFSLVAIILIVLTFILKKKTWTKWVLVGGNIVLVLGTIALMVFIKKESYFAKGWVRTETVFVSEKTSGNRILVQMKTDSLKQRFLHAQQIVAMVSSIERIDPDNVPADVWRVVNKAFAPKLNVLIQVDTEPDFLKAVKENSNGRFAIKNDMEFHDNIVIASLDGAKIESGLPEQKLVFSAPERITFRNCKNVDLRDLTFSVGLVFENCESVVLKNCTFEGEMEEALYFDDTCDGISVHKCKFGAEIASTINAPQRALSIYQCTYNSNSTAYSARYDRITVRGYIFDKNIPRLYKHMLTTNGSNMFEENKSGVEILEGYTRKRYRNPVEWGTEYSLMKTLEEELPSIDFYHSLSTMLSFVAGGMRPYLSEPAEITGLDPQDLPEFTYINPEYVRWWSDNMLPKPTDRIGLRTAKQLYEKLFAYDARLYAECYLRLHRDSALQTENIAYDYLYALAKENDSEDQYIDINLRLDSKYAFRPLSTAYTKSDSDFDQSELEYKNTLVAKITAFWARRYIDGSDEELFAMLQKILQDYDPEFQKFIHEQYPME